MTGRRRRWLGAAELEADTAFHARVVEAVNFGPDTARLAAEFAPNGLQAAAGGRRSPGPGDPTGNAATSLRGDPSGAYGDMLAEAWRRYFAAAQTLVAVTNIIRSHGDHQSRATTSRIPACANRNCGEDILPPDRPIRGRCQACAKYLESNDRDASDKTVKGRARKRAHDAKRAASHSVAPGGETVEAS